MDDSDAEEEDKQSLKGNSGKLGVNGAAGNSADQTNDDEVDPYYFAMDVSLRKTVAFYKRPSNAEDEDASSKKNGDGSIQDEESDENLSEDDQSEDEKSSEEELDDVDDEEWEDVSSDEENSTTTNESNEKLSNTKSKIESKQSKSDKSKGTKSLTNDSSDVYDEYADGDSSDEEEIRNTIGNVPVEWYDEYDHIGYDHSGEKILKPDRGDSLDAFLKRIEDPNYRRTVVDKLSGQDVQLTDGDLELVHRLIKAQVPSAQYNLYEPFLDLYSHEVMETPLSGRPEHKRSFLPSKSERKKVSKMVHNMKQGLIHRNQRPKRFQVFDLWKSDTIPVPMRRRLNPDYKAPPARLPTNLDSYNPPPEFLPSKAQLAWVDRKARSEKQKMLLEARLPKKYKSLRQVPTHPTYVMDIFNRCLDLYMSSRFAYRKVKGQSKDLLPDLPRPRDLRPYPTNECVLFAGHRSIVRCLSVHPLGKMLATGSDDHTVRIWEINTSHCVRTLEMGDAVHCVAWSPNTNVFALAVAVGRCAIICNPETYLTDKAVVVRTNALFQKVPDSGDYVVSERVKKAVQWLQPSTEERAQGYRIVIKHSHNVKQFVWHQKGDYFATLQPDGNTSSVLLHQLSRWRSQIPFSRAAVKVTALSFHPKHAYFYICCQGRIRVYSLTEKKSIRSIRTNSSSEWISSIAVHPTGDHFIVGSHGKRITWYEMECTNRPYTLRYHHGAVRSVAFHNKYPLFASSSDDGRVIVTHAMVYKDWMKDPLLVPVKELFNHAKMDCMCVLQVAWHPQNPLLFTAGADSTVRMWQ